MKFKKMELADIETLRPYFGKVISRTCDFTTGGMMIWRHLYNSEFAVEDGALYSFLRDTDGTVYYNLPLCDDVESAVHKLVSHIRRKGETVRFCTVPEEYVDIFKNGYPDAEITPQREYFDYLYSAEDMKSLRGKRFNGQRNHISRFKRSFGGYEFLSIDEIEMEKLSEFYARITADKEGFDEFALCEYKAIIEMLENWDIYKMSGGVLLADGEIVGFSVGEIINDTLIIHVEKADRTVPGAYQMLFCEFAKRFAGKALYINREDDMGSEGLRQAKLALHPIALLEKYTVVIP